MNILLISYNWYPQQNPRAFRWDSLVEYLLQLDSKVNFFVLVPKISNEMSRVRHADDRKRVIVNEVPNESLDKLIRSKKDDYINNIGSNSKTWSYSIARFFYHTFVVPFYWPDRFKDSIGTATKIGKGIIRRNNIDLVLSNALPFSSHVVAYNIVKDTSIPLILEYGDPFSFNPTKNIIHRFLRFLDARYEKRIIHRASSVVVPTNICKEGFIDNLKIDANKIHVIPQSMKSISETKMTGILDKEEGCSNFLFTGTFLKNIRNPKNFLMAMDKMKKEKPSIYSKTVFHVVGDFLSVNTLMKRYLNLLGDKHLKLYGKLTRNECLSMIGEADFVVNFANESPYQMPSKLIDYARSKETVITIAPDADTYKPSVPKEYAINDDVSSIAKMFEDIVMGYFSTNYSCGTSEFEYEDIQIDTVGKKYYKVITQASKYNS